MKWLFHTLVTVLNSYVLVYDQMYVVLPYPAKGMEELPLRARCIFLTMWCLMLQTVYHFLALLCDILGEDSSKKRLSLHQVRDALFSLAFPLALYVSLAFWALYFYDRNLIFPEYLDNVYPPLFNHVMHTTVALFMVVELLITYREYPRRFVGVTVITSFMLSYVVWFFYLYVTYDAWVYPVFNHFNWPQRVLFVTTSVSSASMLYIVGEKLNGVVCPKPKSVHKNGVTNGKSKNS